MDDSNENRYENRGGPYTQQQRSTSPMAIAAITCAILGLLFFSSGYFSLVFGSLAILFAFLSKGSRDRVQRPATYGRLIGLIDIGIGVLMITLSLTSVIRQYGSLENYYDSYLTTIEETYGIDLGRDSSL